MNPKLTQQILKLQPGDHLCLFYDRDPGEQMPALIPFIQEALSKGEQFLYVADDQTVEELARRLVRSGIDVDGPCADGQLKLWTRQDWRPPGNHLSSQRKLLQIRRLVDEALEAGFKGVRFAFEMTWALDPDIDVHELEHWEATLNTILVPGFPGRMICQYNRSRFSPEVLRAALHTHPQVILGEQICANVFYQAPLILARGDQADGGVNGNGWIAILVEWMISQLKRAQTVGEGEREELLQKEAAFAKSDAARNRIEQMLNGINDGCVTLDAEWRFTHVNEAAARLLGKPAAELLGKIYWHEFPAMLEGHLEQACKCARAEQITLEFDDVFLPGGRWFEVKTYPVSPGEVCLCFRDITEHKQTAETSAALRRELEAQAEDLRQLQELSGQGPSLREIEPMLRDVLRAALMVDGADMGLLSLSDPQRKGLRTGASSGLGSEFLSLSEFIPDGAGVCGMCYEQGRVVIVEDVKHDPLLAGYQKAAKAGGFRGVHCTPLTTRGGRTIGVLSIFFRQPHRPSEREIRLVGLYSRQAADSIENARRLNEVTVARDAAEQASRAKDNLLAALSHELRAPLNPVLLLASEGAGNLELPADVREDFNSIARNVALEALLIDDLLDVTGKTHGKRAFEMRALDVHDILQNALVATRPELERKRIGLTLGLRAKQHGVMGDAVRLQQICWNVLNNAVKFTSEKGMIVVETRSIATKGILTVKIVDTGIGMTTAELGSVFNAFARDNRVDRSGSARVGGSGLGLAHSRVLVELHGGRIRAFSAGRDQGSTFVIELPLVPAEEKAGGSASPFPVSSDLPLTARADAAGRRCRILLVEDHEPTRIALAKLLVRRRYEVATAGSVAEAVALADQKDFDLLVADIGLPDADGYELMVTLRKRHGLKGIAVTGYGMEQDVARSKAAGFVAHLTKPVSAQMFEHALAAAAAR